MSSHLPSLPDGKYPYIDEFYPLADMQMIVAPPQLEALLSEQAKANGTQIIRGAAVEINCKYAGDIEATFLIWWPYDQKMHILVPKDRATGLA